MTDKVPPNRKRADTSWPEHEDRVKSGAERVRVHRARKAAKSVGLEPGEPELEAPTEEDAPTETGVEPSVRAAVLSSLGAWGKTKDPLASVALGLAQSFDKAVSDGSPNGAAIVSEKLVSVLDRIRPISHRGAAPESAPEAGPPGDPAEFVRRREARLAEAAKRHG